MSGKCKMDEYPASVDGYRVIKQLLGHGAFAVVIRGQKEGSEGEDDLVAIKVIHKMALNKASVLIEKELNILKELSTLKHENLVSLLACKEIKNNVFFVMEYCNGGDLADYMQSELDSTRLIGGNSFSQLEKGRLCELAIRVFLKQIASGVSAIHSKGIVHRDLKPQNILLCVPNATGRIHTVPATEIKLKIADFGFARFLEMGNMAATICGSPMYMAPEVIMSQKYDAKADLWSIGTIIYQCLVGTAPFEAKSPGALKRFYLEHRTITPRIPQTASSEIGHLLKRLLCKDPNSRIDFDEFFKHPFLMGKHRGLRSEGNQNVQKSEAKPILKPDIGLAVDQSTSRGGAEFMDFEILPEKECIGGYSFLFFNILANSKICQSHNIGQSYFTEPPSDQYCPTVSNDETLAQLQFVRQLVLYLGRLAEKRIGPPFWSFVAPKKALEELVLGMRISSILSSTLKLAQQRQTKENLKLIPPELELIKILHKSFADHVTKCERIVHSLNKSGGFAEEDKDCWMVESAEQLIYSHALNICSDSICDERLGWNLCEVAQRYSECQVLFHYLSELVSGSQRTRILRMREAVEDRLAQLQRDGILLLEKPTIQPKDS